MDLALLRLELLLPYTISLSVPHSLCAPPIIIPLLIAGLDSMLHIVGHRCYRGLPPVLLAALSPYFSFRSIYSPHQINI